MKVLFVRSGNKGTDPVSTRQGESLRKAGVDVTYYDVRGKGLSGYLGNILPLRRCIREAGADVVHAHYGLCGFIAGLACSGKPVVTSLMGSDLLGTGSPGLSALRFFSRFVWDETIVKTAEMHRKLGLSKARVIPNGIDLECFYPHDREKSRDYLGWNHDTGIILFCADPHRAEKNFALAEKALARFRTVHPEIPVELRFLKGIDPDEVVHYYCAADLLLVTSHHEGSSNSVKEAMACNCPVVSADVGDVRQIVSGTEGCFITGYDPEEIAEAIFRVLTFGRRTDGRTRILHLSSDRMASEIAAVYSGLLKKSYGGSNN